MIRIYSLLFGLFVAANVARAQYSLIFCEDVSGDGKPSVISNSFVVDEDGGVLKFFLRADEKLNTSLIDFRIYYVSDSGKEEEIVRMPQKTDPNWDFAWKEVVFFDPGTYKVKVYTEKGTYLTSANLSIKGM